MPLDENIRMAVISAALKGITPRLQAGQKPIEWFLEQFDFVNDASIQKQVAEAFYQARFNEKMRDALGLKGDFNNTFIKTQIILYASIYEALIDYFLEVHAEDHRVSSLLEQTILKPVKSAVASNVKIVVEEQGNENELVLCKRSIRKQKLKEIQFKYRLEKSIEIGMVQEKYKEDIQKLYESRNSVHLIAAAAANVRPTSGQSAKAFFNMKYFLSHLRKWVDANPVT